ncbi:MAG: MFS transporter [Acidobacteria bacterium]|nr:MFS transporter [Acidobacteriota bacterium]
MRDRQLIYAAAFLRAVATGLLGVTLGIYLARLDFSPAAIGAVVSAGLAGAVVAMTLATWSADRLGRRRFLLGLALLAAAGAAAAAVVSGFPPMLAAAFFGMLNGMGRDRGAALVLEQAILPSTLDDAGRTRGFAWYNVLLDVGHAAGAMAAALPALARAVFAIPESAALRLSVASCAALLLAGAAAYAFLTPAAEAPTAVERARVSPATRRTLVRISALFGLDSLAGGFLGTALLSYFFFERFGAGEAAIALLFLLARTANAVSHLGAAWLARRIGLVNTMVFTHLPSSLLLVTVAWAPSFAVAAALFVLREGLVEMDVPTRQSYVMAVVRPEERTVAAGVTHLVRLGGWAVGPTFAGALMQGVGLGTPLVIGAAMKIVYDVMLYGAFRHVRPPEEAR